MKTNRILAITVFCFLLIGIPYYYGVVYSFRNFAGSDSWRPIKEFHFNEKKKVIKQRILNIDKFNTALVVQEDTSARLKGYGWFTLSICHPVDTTGYFLEFSGDSLQWDRESTSVIILLSITNKEYDISSVDFKETDKKATKKMIDELENLFVNPVRSMNNKPADE